MRKLLPFVGATALLIVPASVAANWASKPLIKPRAADLKVAKAMLVPSGDLSRGFTVVQRPEKDNTIDTTGPCYGYGYSADTELDALTETAVAYGPTYANPAMGVVALSSQASVFASAGQAARMLKIYKSGHTTGCLTQIESQLAQTGMSISRLRMTPVSINVGGLSVFEWDMTMVDTTASGSKVPVEMVWAFYSHRRSLSMLSFIGVPGAETVQAIETISAAMAKAALTGKPVTPVKPRPPTASTAPVA